MSKIIAFCGCPNSGKTVTSLKVARELAKRKNPETGELYNVAYVSTNYTVPALPSIFPCRKMMRSLSNCLTDAEINQTNIFASAMTIDTASNIIYLGFKDGENSSSFPLPPYKKAESLFLHLRQIADFIIVDCDSYINDNMLLECALSSANRIVYLFGYSLKDISYVSSLKEKAKYRLDSYHTIRCVNHREDISKLNIPIASIINKYGGVDYTLPFNKEIRQQELEGNLAYDTKHKKYAKVISGMADKIENEEEKTVDG